jgi:hypothetical protein
MGFYYITSFLFASHPKEGLCKGKVFFQQLFVGKIRTIYFANPQKRPPQVPKSFIKCRENTVFGGLVGAFFGEPT